MKSVDFPQRTAEIGKDQPQYETLFAHVDNSVSEVPMTSCFELTDEEIAEIVATRKIWHSQWTFGNPFQPVRMSTSNPFSTEIEPAKITEKTFKQELTKLINIYSKENESNTPDHVLTEYLNKCLENFNQTVMLRDSFRIPEQAQY